MRRLCYALFVVLLLASCRDKVICPAFQSTYILDDQVRDTYFSYAWYLGEEERNAEVTAQSSAVSSNSASVDSLGSAGSDQLSILPPDSLGAMVASTDKSAGIDYFAYTADYKVPPRQPKRTKYGIVKRTPLIPNFVRNIQLKTSPRENVLLPPEATVEEEEIAPEDVPADSAAIAPLDSTATVAVQDSLGVSQPPDSTAISSVDEAAEKKKAWEQFKYGFNPLDSMQPDQRYYFERYGWLLQNAAPKEEPVDSTQMQSNGLDSIGADSTSQRKGLKGLFKKKGDKPKKEKRKKNKDTEAPESEAPTENTEATKPEEGESGEGGGLK